MSGRPPGGGQDRLAWLLSVVRLAMGLVVLARAGRCAARGERGRAAYFAVLGARLGVQGGARVAGGSSGRTLAGVLDRIADPVHAATMLPFTVSRPHRRFAAGASASATTWWLLDRFARRAG